MHAGLFANAGYRLRPQIITAAEESPQRTKNQPQTAPPQALNPTLAHQTGCIQHRHHRRLLAQSEHLVVGSVLHTSPPDRVFSLHGGFMLIIDVAAPFLGYDDAHALKATSRWVACLPEVAVRTTQEAYRMSFESRKMAIHDRDVEEYAESEEFSEGWSIDSDGHWHERLDQSPWDNYA